MVEFFPSFLLHNNPLLSQSNSWHSFCTSRAGRISKEHSLQHIHTSSLLEHLKKCRPLKHPPWCKLRHNITSAGHCPSQLSDCSCVAIDPTILSRCCYLFDTSFFDTVHHLINFFSDRKQSILQPKYIFSECIPQPSEPSFSCSPSQSSCTRSPPRLCPILPQ